MVKAKNVGLIYSPTPFSKMAKQKMQMGMHLYWNW